MKVTYDPEVDVLRILFRDVPIEESDEDKPGVILDHDKDGNVVGMEVLNASQRVENPRGVDYAATCRPTAWCAGTWARRYWCMARARRSRWNSSATKATPSRC